MSFSFETLRHSLTCHYPCSRYIIDSSESTTNKNSPNFIAKEEVDRKIPADSRKPAAPIDGSINKWYVTITSMWRHESRS